MMVNVRLAIAFTAVAVASAAFATPPIFPADNPWNQPITSAPVAAASGAIMAAIVGAYGNGRLHPDFGQNYGDGSPLYGIPYNVVQGVSVPRVTVVIDAYPGESDPAPAPIPAGAIIEGDRQNGPTFGVNARGDSHLIVWDVDANIAYEFYRASRPSENSDGRWHADGEAVWDFNANSFRPLGWTSADAAGLPILAGLARPDEALPTGQGGDGVIRHAIRFTLTNDLILNKFIYPASHTANPGNSNAAAQPPMGTRFRLRASVNISALNPQSRVVAQAMKDYGLMLADNGSNFFFSGASSSPADSGRPALTWSDSDIQDSTRGLKSLHYADFEVVDLTPAVVGVSPAQGGAGTAVTISGRNFSGAAGRLRVLFGAAAATGVVVVDDAHIGAVAPAGGTGVVDVLVQSGVSVGTDPRNAASPIFGYGVSAPSGAARFTYVGGAAPCCRGATCSLVAPSACLPGPGTAGAVTAAGACNTPGSGTGACCFADYNKAGGVSVQDIFDFLGDYFAGSPLAHFGGDGSGGAPTTQSLFDFLAAYFVGC